MRQLKRPLLGDMDEVAVQPLQQVPDITELPQIEPVHYESNIPHKVLEELIAIFPNHDKSKLENALLKNEDNFQKTVESILDEEQIENDSRVARLCDMQMNDRI